MTRVINGNEAKNGIIALSVAITKGGHRPNDTKKRKDRTEERHIPI